MDYIYAIMHVYASMQVYVGIQVCTCESMHVFIYMQVWKITNVTFEPVYPGHWWYGCMPAVGHNIASLSGPPVSYSNWKKLLIFENYLSDQEFWNCQDLNFLEIFLLTIKFKMAEKLPATLLSVVLSGVLCVDCVPVLLCLLWNLSVFK